MTNKTMVLYSSRKQNTMIEGVELPKSWSKYNNDELRSHARQSILELSKSSNSNVKAKELGFKDAEHLMQICFDYILK